MQNHFALPIYGNITITLYLILLGATWNFLPPTPPSSPVTSVGESPTLSPLWNYTVMGFPTFMQPLDLGPPAVAVVPDLPTLVDFQGAGTREDPITLTSSPLDDSATGLPM